MKKFKKTGDASVRVLETLKLLHQGSSSIQDIINHFEKLDPNNRIYTNEVILKYINTIKVFGLRFVKNRDKYVLLNTPSQFDFSEKELKVIYLIEKFSALIPEEKVKSEINAFLQELEKRFSDNTRLIAHSMTKPKFSELEFNYSKYSHQVKEYEKYCTDKQRLKVVYRNLYNNIASIMVEPNEINYHGNEVYLNVYNPISAQIQEINFDSIISIEQLPLRSNPTSMLSSVTFKLKDRLAKNYKLHENEELINIENNGDITIINRKEDRHLLLKRLMKYCENCEILSPKNLRQEMKELIKTTLLNYK